MDTNITRDNRDKRDKNETSDNQSLGSNDSQATVGGEQGDTGESGISGMLSRAVQAIASRCDGASERDGKGFNLLDAPLGNSLALLSPEQWTPRQSAAAYKMLRKYRSQLAAAGIRYEDIPAPLLQVAPKAPPLPPVTFYPDGAEMIELSLAYNLEMVTCLKASVPQSARWFDPIAKRWRIYLDMASIEGLTRFADEFGVILPEQILSLMVNRLTEYTAALAARAEKPPVTDKGSKRSKRGTATGAARRQHGIEIASKLIGDVTGTDIM